jgi:hypothetical protein
MVRFLMILPVDRGMCVAFIYRPTDLKAPKTPPLSFSGNRKKHFLDKSAVISPVDGEDTF